MKKIVITTKDIVFMLTCIYIYTTGVFITKQDLFPKTIAKL